MRSPVMLVLVLATLPIQAQEKKSLPIEGKWEVVSSQFDGGKTNPGNGRSLNFGHKEFTAFEGEKKSRTLSFKIDDAAKPGAIDIERPDGTKALGIYSIEKDELKLCYAEPGGARPTEFASKTGSKVFLVVLKRTK